MLSTKCYFIITLFIWFTLFSSGKGHLQGSWKLLFESVVGWSLQWGNISDNGFWYLKYSVPRFLVTLNNLLQASKNEGWKKVRKSVVWNRSWSRSQSFQLEEELNKSSHFLHLQNEKLKHESVSQIRNLRQQAKFKFKHKHNLVPQYLQMVCLHYTVQESWKNRLKKLHIFLHLLSLPGIDWFLFSFLSKTSIVSYECIWRRVT